MSEYDFFKTFKLPYLGRKCQQAVFGKVQPSNIRRMIQNLERFEHQKPYDMIGGPTGPYLGLCQCDQPACREVQYSVCVLRTSFLPSLDPCFRRTGLSFLFRSSTSSEATHHCAHARFQNYILHNLKENPDIDNALSTP